MAKYNIQHLQLLFFVLFLSFQDLNAQTEFVHPGGLHTLEDLNRMKTKVAEGKHPWIDSWNLLKNDPLAQNTHVASPRENMNLRQIMSRDAHAAYLNAIRWYISGDISFAECAIGILNNYSSTLNQIPSGGSSDIVGLGGIGIAELALAAEVMRIYDGWNPADFERFKKMMVDYLYPVCHDFLTNHNGACIDYYWANWDANNITALIAIGVLCDNQEIYNEGVNYFMHGTGTGSIKHAVYHVHDGNLGQWQESGRDQEHGQLGVGLLSTACQIAWNQGLDLFGYDENRLLAGAEYTAKYNQMHEVPFKFYNNCQPSNNKWPAINGRGRLDDRPVWEMIYNHYVVRQGLNAPYTQRMAELMRPEHGSKDHFGYGTLTFTLDESNYPPHPAPDQTKGLIVLAGTDKIFLNWDPDYYATGYVVQRSLSRCGEFSTIDSLLESTNSAYTDYSVTNGMTYFYRIAAVNQSGVGKYSEESLSAMPLSTGGLTNGWEKADIATKNEGKAEFADVAGATFVVSSYGTQIGGAEDEATYCYQKISGDYEITCRISGVNGTLNKTGLMIRESLEANSVSVSMTLGEGGGRFARMAYRKTTGGPSLSTLGNTYTWLPAWFRIKREGDQFIAYESSNGEKWFEVDRVVISMSTSYYIGFAVASESDNSKTTTTFDHVVVKNTQEVINLK